MKRRPVSGRLPDRRIFNPEAAISQLQPNRVFPAPGFLGISGISRTPKSAANRSVVSRIKANQATAAGCAPLKGRARHGPSSAPIAAFSNHLSAQPGSGIHVAMTRQA
jgi:hypothetical protein